MPRAPITIGNLLSLALGATAGAFLTLCIIGNLLASVLIGRETNAYHLRETVLLLSVTLGAMLGAYVANRMVASWNKPLVIRDNKPIDAEIVPEDETHKHGGEPH